MGIYRCPTCEQLIDDDIAPAEELLNGELICPDCFEENAWEYPEYVANCMDCGADLGPPGKEVYPKTGHYENRYVMGDRVVCLNCYDGAPDE